MDISRFSIVELKTRLQAAKGRDLKAMLEALAQDDRIGARRLAASRRVKLDWEHREAARIRALIKYESDLAKEGYRFIAGVDEVGRGSLAGPLVAGAVVLGRKTKILGINDSKKLAPARRNQLADVIKTKAIAWAVAEIAHWKIDKIGLQAANISALEQAVGALEPGPDFIIADGFKVRCRSVPSMVLIKGDTLSQSVAAASIIAKVYRDELMTTNHERFPAYGFNINKGYGTAKHIAAIKELGPCELHRRSFFPVSDYGCDQLTLGC